MKKTFFGLLIYLATVMAGPSGPLAEADSKTVRFSDELQRQQVLGVDLELTRAIGKEATIDLTVICQGDAETPALELDRARFGESARLINTTSDEFGCSSYVVQLSSSSGLPHAPADLLTFFGVGVAIDSIAQTNLGLSDSLVFVFNPVHGNWMEADRYMPNQAEPTKAYANLGNQVQRLIAGSIVTPKSPEVDVAANERDVLSNPLGRVSPSSGLLNMSLVEPTSEGLAKVALPLLLRPSRGPGPSFSIINSPEVGTGVLGRGWDVHFGKVTVRGPAPLYHESFETEDYVLDGMDLVALDGEGQEVPPIYKGGPILPRVDGVRVFRTRDSSEGLIVRRYGSDPNGAKLGCFGTVTASVWDLDKLVPRLGQKRKRLRSSFHTSGFSSAGPFRHGGISN